MKSYVGKIVIVKQLEPSFGFISNFSGLRGKIIKQENSCIHVKINDEIISIDKRFLNNFLIFEEDSRTVSYVELEELAKENEMLKQQIDSLYQQLIEKDCELKGAKND